METRLRFEQLIPAIEEEGGVQNLGRFTICIGTCQSWGKICQNELAMRVEKVTHSEHDYGIDSKINSHAFALILPCPFRPKVLAAKDGKNISFSSS